MIAATSLRAFSASTINFRNPGALPQAVTFRAVGALNNCSRNVDPSMLLPMRRFLVCILLAFFSSLTSTSLAQPSARRHTSRHVGAVANSRSLPRSTPERQGISSAAILDFVDSADRQIDTAPDIRNDGDTTIIPVVEERLVVEKRLFLREEIHVHRRRVVTQFRQNVTLRSQDVVVERRDAAADRDRTETPQEG